jgi:TolB protein
MNADGSNLHAITHLSHSGARQPAWSPAGKRIAFSWYSPAGQAMYVVDVDGSNLRRLSPDAAGSGQSTWSPDGRWVAFAGSTPGRHGALYAVRPDGTA